MASTATRREFEQRSRVPRSRYHPLHRRHHRGTRSRRLRRQALDREADLLWEPDQVATRVAALCDQIEPERVLVDHVSFGSTLAMYATGRPFVTVVPGHPSQLPVGNERYGVPRAWPSQIRPDRQHIVELESVSDRVTKYSQRGGTPCSNP